MNAERAFIVLSDMLTPYGRGTEACWEGLRSGKTAISRLRRFNTAAFQSDVAGIIEGPEYLKGESLVMQLLRALFDGPGAAVPEDAKLILASTKGEVDLMERSVLEDRGGADESNLANLLVKVRALAGVRDGGMVVSSACASSSAALAVAASIVRMGRADCVLVVACDSVTEFIFSGFSSLMALDKTPARPFDRKRAGLSVGEAAAYALVMGESRALREGHEILGEIKGWGLSCDANHMTGPSRDGSGQALAIRKALDKAEVGPKAISAISAHGTGTKYNDSMEMKAFHTVFKGVKRPVYSIKGGIGHTMGAAGLLEALVALRSVGEGVTPPTLNLRNVDEEAEGWVFPEPCNFGRNRAVLTANSGFGGVNAALVLGPPPGAS